MRKPVDAPLGDGTAEHEARGVKPAQDYPCPIGTPVRAPFAAVRIVRWGDDDALGGYALTGYAANGDYWVHQHLSEYRNGDSAGEGDVVALSGNSGRWTEGPHLHHYVVLNGIRYNPEDIGLYTTPASAGSVTFNPNPEEYPNMFIANVNGSWFLVVPQGNGKPRAAVLGGDSGANGSGLPVINFNWEPSIQALRQAVDGL